MSWSKTYKRTTEPRPYDHVTFCPLCGIEIGVLRSERMLAMPEVAWIEAKIKEHLFDRHRFRYRLWRRLGSSTSRPYRWLITGLGR